MRDTIHHAQNFLVVEGLDGKRRLLDIECLLSIHPPEKVVGLIDRLIYENKIKLKKLICRDKSDPRVDQTVSRIFRFKMCRSTIANMIVSVSEAA